MPSKSVAWMQDNGHRPDSVHLSPRLSIPWTPLEVSTSFILMSAGAEPNQVVVGTVVLVRKLFAPVQGRSTPSEGVGNCISTLSLLQDHWDNRRWHRRIPPL
jgi:hypothetical protein